MFDAAVASRAAAPVARPPAGSIADAVIVGGGLAGASAAIHLARGGARVTLIERQRAAKPKVCGEFLSAVALGELTRLGFDPGVAGAGAITTVRLAAGGSPAAAPSPSPLPPSHA